MTATSESRSTTIWPTLRYLDARAAIHFLVSTFGFVEKAVYGEGDVVDHAQLDWPGGGGIMLGSPRTDSAIAGLPPGIGSVYIVVDDADAADALHERAVAAGARSRRDCATRTTVRGGSPAVIPKVCTGVSARTQGSSPPRPTWWPSALPEPLPTGWADEVVCRPRTVGHPTVRVRAVRASVSIPVPWARFRRD